MRLVGNVGVLELGGRPRAPGRVDRNAFDPAFIEQALRRGRRQPGWAFTGVTLRMLRALAVISPRSSSTLIPAVRYGSGMTAARGSQHRRCPAPQRPRRHPPAAPAGHHQPM